MNQRRQTLILVVLALAAVLVAWVTRPATVADPRFADVGQPLAPALTDPNQVRQIEVIGYDRALARHTALLLRFRDGRWIIPSAADYPADATSRIAQAAAMLIGLTREAVVSERRIDHASLGLVDPTDVSGDPEGRGVKVTITGEGGQTLADVVIGGAFEGVSRERFVRLAGADRAYRTTFHAPPDETLSTSLVDWINPDLLRLDPAEIVSFRLDASTVDETQGVRIEGEQYEIRRGVNGAWAAPDGQIDRERAEALARQIAGLRVVGVDPMPSALVALLTGASADASLDAADLTNLQRAGFFLSPRGQLVANAGNLILTTAQGLEITLWFGELAETVVDTGPIFAGPNIASPNIASPNLTGDTDAPAAPDGAPAETRYVFVTVRPADPQDEAAAAAAQERSTRLAGWWRLIEEPSVEAVRPSLGSLRAPDEEPGQPAP